MLNVALTGSVAAGKSRVAAAWERAGVPVISADRLAREAVLPGTPGLAAVRAEFGPEVMALDGTLDRDAMRRLVFRDADARARLEAILHPIIGELREAWAGERRAEGAGLIVSEVPLLYEKDLQAEFDVVVLVRAPDGERLRRLTETRGLSEEEAGAVMSSQWPQERKADLADVVIDNAGTVEAVEAEALRVLEELRARAGVTPITMDLHLHTAGSWDCLSDPEEVLRRMLELGFDRIAITDHNVLSVAREMAEKHPRRIVPGEEVKTEEGIDVIGLYLREEIPKGTPARETIRIIREQGGVPYLPHPYAPGKGGGGAMADELAALCDVVEIFNARLHDPTANPRAEELATRHGKLVGGGSDAHTLGELGNVRVVLPDHPNRPDALLAALASAEVSGREAPIWVHLGSTFAKVRKKLPGGR